MPRQPKPPRLWLRPATARQSAVWIIVDGRSQRSTGCAADARGEAERQFGEYLGRKHNPAPKRHRSPDKVLIDDVLAVYLDDVVPKLARPAVVSRRIDRVGEWWGGRTLAEVTPALCMEYEAERTRGGSRRDLEDLRAAIQHHAKRELHSGTILVALPPKGKRRTAFLTRSEVARLLWACWRHTRPQVPPRGARAGTRIEGRSHDLRHLARFILVAFYTGSRSGAILSASIYAGANRSFVDLDSGTFFRLAEDVEETNKRQPPVRIPDELLAHIRRWRDRGSIAQYLVEWHGKPVKSIKTAWRQAVALSGITKAITPHTLRHTAATNLLAAGVEPWEVGGFLGMSETMVKQVYGHHSPDFQKRAARRVGGKRR